MQVIWRDAIPRDYPGITACHRQLEQKLGAAMDLPAYDCASVMLWRVAERNGEIVQFYYVEAVAELRMGGSDCEALQLAIDQEAPQLFAQTKAANIRYLHVCVPPKIQRNVGRHLKRAGIKRSSNVLFAADLR